VNTDPARRLPRAFWYLWSSQAISLVGSALQTIVIPLWIYERTGSVVSTGFSFAVQFVPLVVLSPWAGHLADRFDRRRLMIVCELLAALTVAGLVWALRADSVPTVYLLLPLLRVFNVLTMPAYQASAVALVPLEQRGTSATVMESVIGLNNALAPLLGTALAAWLGYESVLLVNLASFLIAAALLRGVPAGTDRRGSGNVLRSTIAAVRVLTGNRLLGGVALAEAAYFLLFGADLVLVLLIAQDTFGIGLAGVAAAGAGTGWFLTSLALVSRFKHRPRTVMAVSAIGCPAAALLVVAAVGAGPLAVFLAAMSLGAVNIGVVAGASVVYQREITEDVAGRVFALRRALLNAMLALSYVVMPAAAVLLGRGPTLVLFAGLTALAVSGALLARRDRPGSAAPGAMLAPAGSRGQS
jgi:MFS family permease